MSPTCDTSTHYQSAAPTATTDRVCTVLTQCTAQQYQSTAPTATSNRVCTPDTVCGNTQYQSAAPTATSDRSCAPISTCTSSQYETAAPTATSDRQCHALTVCDPSFQYESKAATSTTDRTCKNLTQCSSSQCESVAPTATTDRQCSAASLVISSPDGQGALTPIPPPPATPQILVAQQGQSQPSLALTATMCGALVNAAWTVDKGALGAFDSNNTSAPTFVSSGAIGGLGNITAGYAGVTSKVQVLVELTASQNGATNAESGQVATTLASLTAGGGIGGVGGEGLGVALDDSKPADKAIHDALKSPTGTATAKGMKFLYPYDGTVWPRGMLAPLLQWSNTDGDAKGVRIKLTTTSGSFTWTGDFAPPAILAQVAPANKHFIRHPIPQDVWDTATNTAGELSADGTPDQLIVQLTIVSSDGIAYGPIGQTWTVARARLSGTIYYQSYGTNLAHNYGASDGALDYANASGSATGSPLKSTFGAAVLSIRGGDPGPKLVSSATQCQVCHSVASKGGRLVVQANGAGSGITENYTLASSGITTSQLHNGIGGDGYPGLTADGSLMLNPNGALQSLPDNTAGNLSTSGLSAVSSDVGVPAFSPDTTHVVFNPQNTVAHPAQELVMMSFAPPVNASSPYTFSNEVEITAAASISSNTDIRPTWPAFFPDGHSVVYQQQLRRGIDANAGDGHTRKMAQGQIYWTKAAASTTPTPLNKLNGLNANGTSYLPSLTAASTVSCTADGSAVGANATTVTNGTPDGDPHHVLDQNYNYEPTVNPVSSGGYAWVVFTSRRMYGNEATLPPFCSDPRGVDLHTNFGASSYYPNGNTNVTAKKLWVAAIDINGNPANDASHPAFYLPAQELLAGNARGFWVLDPCLNDNASCATGDQCCGGYCEPNANANGALQCSNTLPNGQCSPLQGACTSANDCCESDALCVNGFCASPSL